VGSTIGSSSSTFGIGRQRQSSSLKLRDHSSVKERRGNLVLHPISWPLPLRLFKVSRREFPGKNKNKELLSLSKSLATKSHWPIYRYLMIWSPRLSTSFESETCLCFSLLEVETLFIDCLMKVFPFFWLIHESADASSYARENESYTATATWADYPTKWRNKPRLQSRAAKHLTWRRLMSLHPIAKMTDPSIRLRHCRSHGRDKWDSYGHR